MDEGFSPLEQDALVNLGNMWMERSATLIATMTNRKVTITNGRFGVATKEDIEREFPGPRFLAEVNLEEFRPMHLLLPAEDAAVIVDLVIGGDGKGVTVEFSDLHLSVLEEAVNEMSGALADIFSTFFGGSQKVLPTKGLVDGLEGLGSGNIVRIMFDLNIEGLLDSRLHTLLTEEKARDLAGRLLNMAPEGAPSPAPPPPAKPAAPAPPPGHPKGRAAEREAARATAVAEPEVTARPVQLPELTAQMPVSKMGNLDLILDVPLQLTAVLGRTGILIKDLIELGPGSVLELDKLAGEPVDLLVNNKLVARGEVVVIDEKFGVRITDTVSPVERIQGLKG